MQAIETKPGHPLEALLKSRGLKRYWVAEQMGWGTGVLRAVLRGQRDLTASEVVRLADLFNVPPATFLPEVA